MVVRKSNSGGHLSVIMAAGKMWVAILVVVVSVVEMVTADGYYERSLAKMAAVTSENCFTKRSEQLHLDFLPLPLGGELRYLDLKSEAAMTPNMTSLRLAANLALQQAFLHSMLNQVQNTSADFAYQPGILYRYNSVDSYVTATPDDVSSAGVFYDQNASYPNWWRFVPFNTTLDLFGVRATRGIPAALASSSSFDLPDGTVHTKDYAADFNLNYTNAAFKINDWYSAWMPDSYFHSYAESAYTVEMATGERKVFFGPAKGDHSILDKSYLPLQLSRPYFDCGQTNRWVVAVSAPVLDYLPRYTMWQHLRTARVVAASVVTVDLARLDVDPCLAASSSRCKDSTQCRAVEGGGFDPSAYQCVCRPGFLYPSGQSGPFQGADIAKATEEEFTAGFDCVPGPNSAQNDGRQGADVTALLQQMAGVTSQNCAAKRPSQLTLSLRSRDILTRMTAEGRLALRLAHAMAAALQTRPAVNSGLMADVQHLQRTHVIAELTSLLLASPRVRSATAIFDRGQFERYTNWTQNTGDVTYFAPQVWQESDVVKADDLGGQSALPQWVQDVLTSVRSVWSPLVARQRLQTVDRWWEMRIGPQYQYSQHHIIYPEVLEVPAYEDGQWSQPSFKCDGRVDAWVASYHVPFFGSNLQLGGVVVVDVEVAEADLRAVA